MRKPFNNAYWSNTWSENKGVSGNKEREGGRDHFTHRLLHHFICYSRGDHVRPSYQSALKTISTPPPSNHTWQHDAAPPNTTAAICWIYWNQFTLNTGATCTHLHHHGAFSVFYWQPAEVILKVISPMFKEQYDDRGGVIQRYCDPLHREAQGLITVMIVQ